MKPVIGIVVAASRHKDRVMTVESKYMLALEKSGAIPVLFPIYRKGLIPRDKLLSIIDGVLLTGSFILQDKNVKKKMVKKNTTLKDVNPVYYEYCTKLIKKLRKNNIPLLGICRGMQLMVEESGGSVALIPDINGKNINHKQHINPANTVHLVRFEKESLLAKLSGAEMMVNSFHKQCAVKKPLNYRISAYADDGCPEAIESTTSWFSMGLQFHPEWLYETEKGARRIFRRFVNEAKMTHGRLHS